MGDVSQVLHQLVLKPEGRPCIGTLSSGFSHRVHDKLTVRKLQIETNVKTDAETVEGALETRLLVQWLCEEISRDTITRSFRCFPLVFELNPSCVDA